MPPERASELYQWNNSALPKDRKAGEDTTSRRRTALSHHNPLIEDLKARRLVSLRGQWGHCAVCVDAGSGWHSSWIQPHICLWHFIITLSPNCTGCQVRWSICLSEVKVMASHWREASMRKSVTLDKHFISSHTETPSASDFCNGTEDKCSFSTPLLLFSIPFTTLSSLKEKFIWRHKSHLHQEVMQWLVSDRTAKTGRLCATQIGFVLQHAEPRKSLLQLQLNSFWPCALSVIDFLGHSLVIEIVLLYITNSRSSFSVEDLTGVAEQCCSCGIISSQWTRYHVTKSRQVIPWQHKYTGEGWIRGKHNSVSPENSPAAPKGTGGILHKQRMNTSFLQDYSARFVMVSSSWLNSTYVPGVCCCVPYVVRSHRMKFIP